MLISFLDGSFVLVIVGCASSCFRLPSDEGGLEACVSFLMGRTGSGKNWVLLWWAGPCSVKL